MFEFQSAIFSRHMTQYPKRVAGHFETIVPNVPQIAFNNTSSKVPLYGLLLPLSIKCYLFRSKASRFRVTCHFGTSAPNDSKMTLNTKRSKVFHILHITTTCTPVSQTSPHLALRTGTDNIHKKFSECFRV